MFYEMTTERTSREVDLRGRFGGAGISACWLLGGGPSLGTLPLEMIRATPTATMGMNLAGTHLIRPTLWTAYDPSNRFHRSVYLDPSIMKFVSKRRAMDLVPETTMKVCECPNLYLFETDDQRGFADFVGMQHRKIVDWADTCVQAIDLLYQLGFRRIYLAGCEMQVHPSEKLLVAAEAKGVVYDRYGTLKMFVEACVKAGMSREDLERLARPQTYHFEEDKPLASAVQTDLHYFRVVQFLRLSRRALSLAGLELVSVTPGSRLNDHFRFVEVERAREEILGAVGDPSGESTRGRYTQPGLRGGGALHVMKDVLPPRRSGGGREGVEEFGFRD